MTTEGEGDAPPGLLSRGCPSRVVIARDETPRLLLRGMLFMTWQSHPLPMTWLSEYLRIFDDRIEFWNPGRLPEGWTVENLKEQHESSPFNPSIAKIFFWVRWYWN